MNLKQYLFPAYAILLLSIYWTLPTFNYGFWGLPLYILLFILVGVIFSLPISFDHKQSKKFSYPFKLNKVLGLSIIILLAYMTIIPILSSWALFHSDSYRSMIGTVKQGKDFSDHMEPISLRKVRVVDEELAEILGDKVLGAQPALGSQVTLGKFTIQKIKDQLYWVAPLEHSGFFKWWKNSNGTTGYVMVNATNERDVKLVQQVNQRPIRIKYQPSAFFQQNLERHIYFHGYMATGFTDFTFEIDDQGNPFWVVTKFKKKIGFYGEDATGVIVVNAATGAIHEYGIANTPAWIDRVQPREFVEEQMNNWGEYVHGYWNFSNEGKLETTEDMMLVYGEDNQSYWYTGLTSVGADEATIGFVLIDTRTKEAVWYRQSGATEYAAMESAMGKVQEKGYVASSPTPYNINNIPTYVMTLKDDGGLVKMYAMVSIQDYTIVGVGNSLQETLMAYKNAFNASGNKLENSPKSNLTTLKTVVKRIGVDIKNGNSFYYYTVPNEDHIFVGSTQISNDFPLTKEGDSIAFSFEADQEKLIGISTFSLLQK